jgi:hypothetical protein
VRETRRPTDHQPAKFELMLKHEDPRAIGITVPLTLLARADEVIK